MEKNRKLLPWLTWLAICLGLLAAYPLSAGPMCYLAHKGLLPQWFLELPIYEPLDRLSEHVPQLNWYIESVVWDD